MKAALLVLLASALSVFAGQTQPFGPSMSKPKSGTRATDPFAPPLRVEATNAQGDTVASDAAAPTAKETDEERQRRWDKARADLMEKRMREVNAAIEAARKRGQELQAEEAAKAKEEADIQAAEEANRIREKRRLDGIKAEMIRKADEDNAKAKAMAQAVADGVRSEYRRRVIKDWLQITGEVVGGIVILAFAVVGLRRLWLPSRHQT